MNMQHNFLRQEVVITYLKLKVNESLLMKTACSCLSTVVDSTSGEKRYTPNFHLDQVDQKLSTILTSNTQQSEEEVLKKYSCSRCVACTE
jgi:hypothetical protein